MDASSNTSLGRGSHAPALAGIMHNTEGPVLEMGAGDFSTQLLHALCMNTDRKLYTCDLAKETLNLFQYMVKSWHKFIHVTEASMWDNIGNEEEHWGVVFIDHLPKERRAVELQRLRDKVDVFVVHDTNDESFGLEEVLSSFKYRSTFTHYTPHTTVVSDTVDIEKLFDH